MAVAGPSYPNPINTQTTSRLTIPLILSEPAKISLTLYNIIGQEITSVLNQTNMVTGTYQLNFAVSRYASGIYFCRLVANGQVSTEKIVIIK